MAETKNPDGYKKGILFTLSVMLLGISLLSFSFFLAEQTAKARHSAVAILEIDRATNAHANVEDALARIISPSISISVQNSTVQINETLPLNSMMQTDLDRFAQFESRYADLNVSMDLTNLKGGYFVVQPGETMITNAPTAFYVTPKNSPESAGNLQSYDITITYPAGSVDSASWQSVSNATGNSSMAVHVRLQEDTGGIVFDSYQTLDKYRTSMLNITQSGTSVGAITFSSPAALQLDYSGNIGLKASVGFSNAVYVESDDTISVMAAVNKTGKPKIA